MAELKALSTTRQVSFHPPAAAAAAAAASLPYTIYTYTAASFLFSLGSGGRNVIVCMRDPRRFPSSVCIYICLHTRTPQLSLQCYAVYRFYFLFFSPPSCCCCSLPISRRPPPSLLFLYVEREREPRGSRFSLFSLGIRIVCKTSARGGGRRDIGWCGDRFHFHWRESFSFFKVGVYLVGDNARAAWGCCSIQMSSREGRRGIMGRRGL